MQLSSYDWVNQRPQTSLFWWMVTPLDETYSHFEICLWNHLNLLVCLTRNIRWEMLTGRPPNRHWLRFPLGAVALFPPGQKTPLQKSPVQNSPDVQKNTSNCTLPVFNIGVPYTSAYCTYELATHRPARENAAISNQISFFAQEEAWILQNNKATCVKHQWNP